MQLRHATALGCALALGAVACSTAVKPAVPITPIDDAAYAVDKVHFLAEVARVAGAGAEPCGVLGAPGRNAHILACVNDAWAARRAFTLISENRSGYCPNLVAYAGDAQGRLHLIQSCPDRDHREGQILQPSIDECPSFSPPHADNGGFGRCSMLDVI